MLQQIMKNVTDIYCSFAFHANEEAVSLRPFEPRW